MKRPRIPFISCKAVSDCLEDCLETIVLRFMVIPESKVFKIERDKKKDICFFVEVSCVLFAKFFLQFAKNQNATRILPAI